MELDRDLIEELRARARRGERPCALARLISQRLGEAGKPHRLQAIAYFQEAFGLSLRDAMGIGAAPAFEPAGRGADEVDAEMLAILEENRHRWDPAPTPEGGG